MFVDETGFKTDMNRLRGWAEKGLRLVEAVLGGRWETNTLVHAVSLAGTRAAMVLNGPMDAVCFAGYCKYFLAPALRPNDLVVLDNLSSHKTVVAKQAIEAVGARFVFLPPYSPDLNPIENTFSKLKQLVRGFRPKSWLEIVDSVKRALLSTTQEDIENAFIHCGYEAS